MATGARGRGPGLKRPSRRPSGPGNMTSGMCTFKKLFRAVEMSRVAVAAYIGKEGARATITDANNLADRLYLDHAATTPALAVARAAVADGLARWANPSSPHAEGRGARAMLEEARERVKAALDWDGEVLFTSGATEAIAIALQRTDFDAVLVSSVEHDAVQQLTERLTCEQG